MDVEPRQSESSHPICAADFARLFARLVLASRNDARLILPDWTAVDDALQDANITIWGIALVSYIQDAIGIVTLSSAKPDN